MTEDEFTVLFIRFFRRFYSIYRNLSLQALWNFCNDEEQRLKNKGIKI